MTLCLFLERHCFEIFDNSSTRLNLTYERLRVWISRDAIRYFRVGLDVRRWSFINMGSTEVGENKTRYIKPPQMLISRSSVDEGYTRSGFYYPNNFHDKNGG